jgi:sensor histidine kinase YesM
MRKLRETLAVITCILVSPSAFAGSAATAEIPLSVFLTVSIVTLLSAVTAVLVMRRRFKRTMATAEEQKTVLRQRLTDLETKVLRAQMNPHFIFNSLNSINRYIVKSEPEIASAYLTKFGKLIRLILDNSNHRLISLEQELDALKLYIELETMRFNKKFSYSIHVTDEVNPSTFGLPPLIIQPFIENAIWHGLLHKESPGELTIEISRCVTGIRCVVEDNGIGRKKAAELKSRSINTDKSYGLKITTDRIKKINEHSTVTVEDLHDPFGNAAGTRVTLEIAPGKVEEY